MSLCYGRVSPDLALTADMSDELIAPEIFTSNLKLAAVVVCPERAFTLLMSLELTDCVLFASPTEKPIAACTDVAPPLTPLSETVTRWFSGIEVSRTVTSLPDAETVALPIGATLALPGTVIEPSN